MIKLVANLIVFILMFFGAYIKPIPIIQIQTIPDVRQHNQTFSYSIKPQTIYTNRVNLTHYTAQQFARYFHNNAFSSEEILNNLDLYTSNEFIKFIKSDPGYEKKIKELYAKFKNLTNFKKILYRLIGGYSSRLHKRINTLYEAIQKDETDTIKYPKEYSKISEKFNEYKSLEDVYKTYSPLLANALENRLNAFNNDQLQNILHKESSDIKNRTHTLSMHSPLYIHRNALLDCSDSIALYANENQMDTAMTIADFCWTLLDYGQAIAEGAALGLYNSVQDILTHPIEATACILAGRQVLAYQMGKVLYNVAEIGITALHDYDRAREKWDDYIEPINNLINAIHNKEITLRDTIKKGSALVIGYKAQTKLLSGLGKFFTTVKTKVIDFAKTNTLSQPEYYLTTPEGMILKASHNAENIGSISQGVVNPSLLLLETTYAKVSAELKKEIELLQKKYDFIRSGIGDFTGKKIKMNYEHILGMEVNLTKKGKIGLSGFHHDFDNYIEKTGILEFSNKTIDKHGCYKTRLLNKGDYVKEITFFPSHWSREKVISKIYEAYDNFKNKNHIPELKRDGKYIIESATNEGMEIEIFITKNGQITTAYPSIK